MSNPKMATYGKRKDAGTVQLPDHTAKLVLRPSTKALARRRAHSRTTNPKMLKYGNNCGAGTVQLHDHMAKLVLRPSTKAHLQSIAKQRQPATQFGELWDKTMVQQAAGEAPDNPKLTISRQQLRTTVACSTSDGLVDIEEDFGRQTL